MAYDGIVTRAVVRELQNNILLGKIEKVYQPEADELVFHIHTKSGNRKLFASAGSAHARLHFIESNPVNPPAPLSFWLFLPGTCSKAATWILLNAASASPLSSA